MKSTYKIIAIVLVSGVVQSSGAQGISARRLPGEDWKVAAKRELQGRIQAHDSAENVAGPVDRLGIEGVPEIGDARKLQALFERARDERFLVWRKRPDFLRRSTWLYPDDGCFARAALFNQNFAAWNEVRPMKLFVFGNLRVETENSPTGEVTWWFHVVPVVSNGSELIVLDPAISPRKPLGVLDWIKTMTSDIKSVAVSVCKTFTYLPADSCGSSQAAAEFEAEFDQKNFLSLEWDRLEKLNRDPVQELGDRPPWADVQNM